MALTAILGGPGIHQMGYHFVLYPVLLNSVLLAALAILFNNGRATLPARAGAGGGQTGQSADRCRFHHPRRSARGADGGDLFDIDEDDLQEILLRAEQLAHQRQSKTA